MDITDAIFYLVYYIITCSQNFQCNPPCPRLIEARLLQVIEHIQQTTPGVHLRCGCGVARKCSSIHLIYHPIIEYVRAVFSVDRSPIEFPISNLVLVPLRTEDPRYVHEYIMASLCLWFQQPIDQNINVQTFYPLLIILPELSFQNPGLNFIHLIIYYVLYASVLRRIEGWTIHRQSGPLFSNIFLK